MISRNYAALIYGCIVLYFWIKYAFKLAEYMRSKYPDRWQAHMSVLFFMLSLVLVISWVLGWPFSLKWFAPWLWE